MLKFQSTQSCQKSNCLIKLRYIEYFVYDLESELILACNKSTVFKQNDSQFLNPAHSRIIFGLQYITLPYVEKCKRAIC